MIEMGVGCRRFKSKFFGKNKKITVVSHVKHCTSQGLFDGFGGAGEDFVYLIFVILIIWCVWSCQALQILPIPSRSG